ncbi:molybdenum cofactor biosynthesis protein MoaE [Microbacterium amylolyticum]|uniref:Molybdopterin synthase catalytic subunit n=1 Tax=Microbacterium amylolyticum TaxID=936337 RepID=A0ABS4ZEU9_9MICO|nr:molybdenum cofactor biosynthesis protein MoaE [Microbacterium amylolyticum]MBP2435789.1 molybdopterin synthase catalytic subunit [Microbacterium amylolyticum]
MDDVRRARISAEPIDLAAHLAAVDDPRMGAETSFVGRVRNHDPEAVGAVQALEYSSHPDAEQVLRGLAQRAADRTGAIIAVSHRVGRLDVGEAAVVIAVAAPHRAEAFEACRQVIEDIKRELPVWKRQIEQSGDATWKGLGG